MPAAYIDRLKINTEIGPASITVQTTAARSPKSAAVRVTASIDGKQVGEATGTLDKTTLAIEDARLWSPSDPNLYDLKVNCL